MVRRILRDMAELRKICKLVRVTQKLKEKQEKEDPYYGEFNPYHYRDGEPYTTDVKRKYRKPHFFSRKKSTKEIDRIFKKAISKGYLKEVTVSVERIPVHAVHIEEPGRDIIERTMFGLLPRGLLNAWADKNEKSTNIIIGVIIGAIIGIIGNIPTIISLMNPE